MPTRGVAFGPKQSLVLLGAVSLCALAGVCYFLIGRLCLAHSDGRFSYALDDPYIHLAIARNFAFHGVWGVTPYANSAASSSPLWILLLALAMRVAGDWSYWPFVFGILFSLAALIFTYYRFIRGGIGIPLAMLASVAAFAVAPFQILPFTGMEHSMQVFVDLLFVFWLFDRYGLRTEWRDFAVGVVLTFLVCLSRFEGAFLVVVPFFLSAVRRDWRMCLALVVGSCLAIGGFGLFSHLMGMPLLPNSIVLKGNVPHTFSPGWFLSLYLNLRARSIAFWDLLLLTIAMGAGLRWRAVREGTGALQGLLWTVVAAAFFHSGLALVGIFYRYEAYLVYLLVVVSVLALREFYVAAGSLREKVLSQRQWLLALAAVSLGQIALSPIFWMYQLDANLVVSLYTVGIIGLVAMETGARSLGRLSRCLLGSVVPIALYFMVRDRAVQSTVAIPSATSDIYLQQYQMSRFVGRYYSSGRLVANDIGAVSYFSHVHLFDLWGLATDSVRRLKLANDWNTRTMKEQIDAFGPDLVIAYPDWYQKNRAMPSSLIEVATWTIPNVTTAARRVVAFYAPASKVKRLRSQLVEFESSLPGRVSVKYLPRTNG